MANATKDAAVDTAENVSKTIKSRPRVKKFQKPEDSTTDESRSKGGPKKGVNLAKVAQELYERKVAQGNTDVEGEDK